jgi:hypothetical protein
MLVQDNPVVSQGVDVGCWNLVGAVETDVIPSLQHGVCMVVVPAVPLVVCIPGDSVSFKRSLLVRIISQAFKFIVVNTSALLQSQPYHKYHITSVDCGLVNCDVNCEVKTSAVVLHNSRN